jgi:ABC-type Fe3+-hydroxamate transport system substrate-binding protein
VRNDVLVTLRAVVDDLGTPICVRPKVASVVCLVPSLTEAIAESARELLVGATDWCSHPEDLDVTRVRGTKNPNLKKIIDLAPDLVVCNQEENRLLDVERLRAAGIAVWVTQIETLDQAFASMDRLFTIALQQSRPTWLADAEAVWAEPAPVHPTRAVVAVWRDPWIVVGRSTFTGDLLRRLGIDNVFAHHPDRYPHVTLQEIRAASPGLVVLPDEPYAFHTGDGPEAFPDIATALVSGRFLTWYGPSLVEARSALLDQLAQ